MNTIFLNQTRDELEALLDEERKKFTAALMNDVSLEELEVIRKRTRQIVEIIQEKFKTPDE